MQLISHNPHEVPVTFCMYSGTPPRYPSRPSPSPNSPRVRSMHRLVPRKLFLLNLTSFIEQLFTEFTFYIESIIATRMDRTEDRIPGMPVVPLDSGRSEASLSPTLLRVRSSVTLNQPRGNLRSLTTTSKTNYTHIIIIIFVNLYKKTCFHTVM